MTGNESMKTRYKAGSIGEVCSLPLKINGATGQGEAYTKHFSRLLNSITIAISGLINSLL